LAKRKNILRYVKFSRMFLQNVKCLCYGTLRYVTRGWKQALLTLGNTLNIGLRAGYLSVRMAGGTSDRRRRKALRINGLTSLLTYLFNRVQFKYVMDVCMFVEVK